MIKKILFICQANVGRSQMAEGFYNHKTNSTAGSSAGIDDVAAKYNFSPTPKIIEVMQEKNIDISAQKIKPLTNKMVDEVDSVVVLCDKSFCPPWLLESPKVIHSAVEDPFEKDIDSIRTIRDQIEIIIDNLID